MRVSRSGSQILFGHLPEQTIDADGGIWKVKKWNEPKIENAIDAGALREELIRAAYAWHEAGEDDGFVDDLYRQRAVKVRTLNREDGVTCERFPRLFLCQKCKRLHDEPLGRCQCGSTRSRGQLPFVGYHDECGAIKTPYVQKCRTHGQRAVRFPGTASAAELIFYCPVCQDIINRGFGAACDCGQGTLSFTVHRSGTVFKPRGVALINPPRREILQQIDQAGGGERALEWVLDGMTGRRLDEARAAQNSDSIRRLLAERGFDGITIDAMVAAMPVNTQADASVTLQLPPAVREVAEVQARQIALATFESRRTIGDLRGDAKSESLKWLYDNEYPKSLQAAGLERVELIDRFPVLTGQFGYTRGKPTPGASRLRTYREVNGDYTVYGELVQTEALYFRLDPRGVHRWLSANGVELGQPADARSAAAEILSKMGPPGVANPLTEQVTVLVHSYSHALIRRAAVHAGIERNAMAELVLPFVFGFFVYAAARGDFVLGGLQALFETELHSLLDGLVDDEHRCALDPGCDDTGSACAVCLHLGEPSCRMFNTGLSRKALAGGRGYFDITAVTT